MVVLYSPRLAYTMAYECLYSMKEGLLVVHVVMAMMDNGPKTTARGIVLV